MTTSRRLPTYEQWLEAKAKQQPVDDKRIEELTERLRREGWVK